MRLILRIFCITLLAIVLLVLGIAMGLYSPWAQNLIRKSLVDKLNSLPGIEASFDQFRLKFPLKIDIEGLALAQDGDTLVAAQKLQADVAFLPLLTGNIDVKSAFLQQARYQMGNADSLMMMVIKADTLQIKPASVKLSPMDIDIADARIAHGLVSMVSRVDTAAADTAKKEAQEMMIRARRLQLDDFTYQMRMLPTIDSLGATVGHGVLADGEINMARQTIGIKSFTGTGLDAAYIAPDAAQVAAAPAAPAPAGEPAAPWTIEIDTIGFDHSRGLYTTRGVAPQPGLDFAYIQADDMTLAIKNFYDQGSTISLPIELSARERCGVELSAKGTFAMDSALMRFSNFDINTAGQATLLKADGYMGIGDMASDPSLPLKLEARGRVGIPDARLMFPLFKPYLAGLNAPLTVNAAIEGRAGDLRISRCDIGISRVASLRASGRVADMFAKQGPTGHITLAGDVIDVNGIVESMAKGTGLTIPSMKLNGSVDMRAGDMHAKLDATTLGGRIALDASLNSNSESYQAELAADQFPVNAFMEALGVGRVTARASAKGQGYDFFSPKTWLDANVDLDALEYRGFTYRQAALQAHLRDGKADIAADIDNPEAKASVKASGNLDGDTYRWTASVDAGHIDLHAIKMSASEATVALQLQADAVATPSRNEIDAQAVVRQLDFTQNDITYSLSDIRASFATCDSLTQAKITNRDLLATAMLPYGLDSIMARADIATQTLDKQIKDRQVHIDSLQHALPRFDLRLAAGSDNMINDILRERKMSLQRIDLAAANDSALSLTGLARRFDTGSARLDTISLSLKQTADKMHMVASVDNAPGTLDEWAHVRLDALLNSNQIALRAAQRNIDGQTGYDIGAITEFVDSTVTASIFPLNPTIGYKPWKVNFDNYISYTFPTKKIDANLRMTGDKSSLALYTEEPADSAGAVLNDVVLKLSDVRIQDWISINPFAPPIAGSINADMRLAWDGGDDINGKGQVTFADFYYNRERVGTFTSNIDVETNTSGMIRAQADLLVDGQKTVTIAGNLNDSTAVSPFNLDFSVIKFPLSIANPFLPAGMARLQGTLNGTMDIKGDAKNPRVNGEIYFEDAAVKLAMTNTAYSFSDVKIPVVDNIVRFNDFGILGANENPLLISGVVDMSSLASPAFDLGFNASNMMIVNTSSAAKGAQLYGKGYIDLSAKVRGNMKFVDVDADLSVLSGTNVTYLLAFTQSSLQQQSQTGMVKFVNFADSAAVAQADTAQVAGMMMNIDANLNIQSGTTIVVDLATGARDKVQVQPQGTLTYTQAPLSDGRVTGRITINNGFARYSLPVIGSEKEFTFTPGSYVAFNGDMLNPVLSLRAVDEVKTNVTQEGQNSRLVNFDIILDVTGTLSAMDVKFDLATNDDITVSNELQSMSAEQRANQAMNLLLYNMYTGPGTKANGNLAANPLFSFLESQVNNWAAQNIKGVDLSFGIDQYNQTTNGSTSQTMSYSYQVSKTLFNDRFKIVVGGNYSTDDNADENLSQNLINDISFEYYLNSQQTMLVKLFRHTGYESILEGEITKTGVGFVYKRRLSHLSQMLPKFMRPSGHRKIE